jgi:hypothetical protein
MMEEMYFLAGEKAPCVRCKEPTYRVSLFFEAPLHHECEVLWLHEHDKQVEDEQGEMEAAMRSTLAWNVAQLVAAWDNLRNAFLEHLSSVFGLSKNEIEGK